MIYLDNSATTRPCDEAISAMENAMKNIWGNPSSLHRAGSDAAALLFEARNEIYLSILGQRVRPLLARRPGMPNRDGVGRLIFTSSGTESDNLAIIGAVRSCKIKNPKVITTDSEHPAVLNTLKSLEAEGVQTVYLSTKGGVINEAEFENALSADVALITIMHVNNETGAVYDISKLFAQAKKRLPDVICHTDCIQSYLKVPFTPAGISADMITVSAHKVHGPKGVGALWVCDALAKKNRPVAIIHGGGQEHGIRNGTENIPGISSFAAAVKAAGSDSAYKAFKEKTSALRKLIEENLPVNTVINTPKGDFTPHIISITLPVKKSQPMLNYLSAEGIYVSSGSACSSHKDTVSHVLTAFGLSHDEADRTIRVSLSEENTESDVLEFCKVLSDGINKLR